jgi:hypothetical protein
MIGDELPLLREVEEWGCADLADTGKERHRKIIPV